MEEAFYMQSFIFKSQAKRSETVVAQSIFTYYSCFENMGRFVTLKKNQVQNMDLKKAGYKKQDHCYSKREEAIWPLLFLNNNDPVFCTLLFASHIFDLVIFQGHKLTHVFKTRIVGAD